MIIDKELLTEAAHKSFKDHNSDPQVVSFKLHFDENVDDLYNCLVDRTYVKYLEYVKLRRRNSNGKWRDIDSPKLRCRIYQIYWLLQVIPIFDAVNKDIGLAKNCLPDHGILAKKREYSALKCMKHLFYDRRDLTYLLIMDQRQCYAHVKIKAYRKAMKFMYDRLDLPYDTELIDFGEIVGFVNKKLPIGTPTSPYIHNILMLRSDAFIKDNTPWAIRYADDNAIAFYDKQELSQFKWRLQNLWWYEYGMRAKFQSIKIINMNKTGLDFCSYILHRNSDKCVTDVNKGYTVIRHSILRRAKHATPRNYGSYYGLLIHADCFKILEQTEKKMDLDELTAKVKICRNMMFLNYLLRNYIRIM